MNPFHDMAWTMIGILTAALTCFSVVQMMLVVASDAASLATLTVFAMLIGSLNDPLAPSESRVHHAPQHLSREE